MIVQESSRRATPPLVGHLTPAELGRRVAVAASALAGALHYAAVPGHRSEWWVAAAVFTVLGGLQLCWAVLAWSVAARGLLASGLVLHLAAVAGWLMSRIWGLPVGPHAGIPEPAGALDLACVLAEAVAVAALAGALVAGLGRWDGTVSLGAARNRPGR